ncbi:MAG TPA: SDR family oxidoreductase [Edaphocola sp.]|nr:SDR family oxidoreductase [Edaphocola sp.]
MNLDLSNKNALIAGSTQGIGLAIAKELALLGANCTLIARNEEKLKEALQTLDTNNNQKHQYLVADFSDYKKVATIVNEFAETKTIHILINNTGGPAAGPVVDAKPEGFLMAFQQHLICNQVITQAVIPGMKTANYGRIVNVVSTSVKIPLKNLGVSNTIRGAVASWAKTMSNELAPFGITVNNVLPGATATKRLESIIDNKVQKTGNDEDKVRNEMMEEIPMKRFGQPEEIASLAAYLCSPAAAYLTGVSIPVDGGRTGCL